MGNLIKYLLLTIGFIVSCTIKKNGLENFQKAEKYYLKGNAKKAYPYYYKAAEIDKKPSYYVKAAESYFLSHDVSKFKYYNETIKIFNKAFQINEWNREALYARAKFFNYCVKNEDAIRDLNSLIEKYPSFVDSYILKGQILMSKKDTFNAFNTYSLGLLNIEKKDYWNIYYFKGFECHEKGYWRPSINAYLEEIRLDGENNFKSYCMLSSSYFNLGIIDSACYFFKKCDINKFPTLLSKNEIIKECK